MCNAENEEDPLFNEEDLLVTRGCNNLNQYNMLEARELWTKEKIEKALLEMVTR
jgi:hypothetical protein